MTTFIEISCADLLIYIKYDKFNESYAKETVLYKNYIALCMCVCKCIYKCICKCMRRGNLTIKYKQDVYSNLVKRIA